MTNTELVDVLVSVNRCTKVTKGGRIFSFSALAVVGDCNGCIGYGLGKANEVVNAKTKAIEKAKQNMHKVLLLNSRTLHHDIFCKYRASKVILRPAPVGVGIIAGAAVRAICSIIGIKDVVTKSLGSNNPHNLVKATVKGLLQMQSLSKVAARRGKRSVNIKLAI